MVLCCLFRNITCVISPIDLVPLVSIRVLTVSNLLFTQKVSHLIQHLQVSLLILFPFVCMQHVRYLLPLESLIIIPFPLVMYCQTELFHRVLLPSLQVSVRSALTTLDTKISPWTHPFQWLDANTNHLYSIFRAIIHLTQEADIGEMSFPETMIYQVGFGRSQVLEIGSLVLQRLIVYIFAHNMFASGDKTYILYLLFHFHVL